MRDYAEKTKNTTKKRSQSIQKQNEDQLADGDMLMAAAMIFGLFIALSAGMFAKNFGKWLWP